MDIILSIICLALIPCVFLLDIYTVFENEIIDFLNWIDERSKND